MLMPADPRQWLPAGHLAWRVLELAAEMDLSRFGARYRADGLLPESVRACAREGLVSVDLVAGDGTKLKANASMATNVTAAQLDAQIAELEAVIDAEFRQWAQDMLDGDRDGDGDSAAPARPRVPRRGPAPAATGLRGAGRSPRVPAPTAGRGGAAAGS